MNRVKQQLKKTEQNRDQRIQSFLQGVSQDFTGLAPRVKFAAIADKKCKSITYSSCWGDKHSGVDRLPINFLEKKT